jgi:hypothetical protein
METKSKEDAMGRRDFFRQLFRRIRSMLHLGGRELQPVDILDELIREMESKKKLGIEENAFVPNIYEVYLSPPDFFDISPLLNGIRDQLKVRLMERVKKRSYRLLAPSVTIDIREEEGLQMNEIAIESSFVKDESVKSSVMDNNSKTVMLAKPAPGVETKRPPEAKEREESVSQLRKSPQTRIIEERKTTLIDNTEIALEVVEGENKGEIIPLKVGEYVFGRGNEATILLKDEEETISRTHFKIDVKEGRAVIRDLHSLNKTRVNNVDVEEAELKKGDTITAGKVQLKVV